MISKPTKQPKKGSFVTLADWMAKKLNLHGDELIVYGIIYSFSQDGSSSFRGSIKYISFWTGRSRPTVIKILKLLLEKNYIFKKEINYTNLNAKYHYCEYRANLSIL